MKFKQLTLDEWPKWVSQQFVHFPGIDEKMWTEKYGLTFSDNTDDLGTHRACVLKSEKGTQFVLQKWDHPTSQHQFFLLLNRYDPKPWESVREFMELFQLNKAQIGWMHPDIYEIKGSSK